MGEFQDFIKSVMDFAITLNDDTLDDEIEEFFGRIETEIENYPKTGSFQSHKVTVKKERITNVLKEPNGEDFKENEANSKKAIEKETLSRSTRSQVLKDLQSSVNIQTQTIKEERLSNVATDSMPPPQLPVRKGKATKKAPVKVKVERDSDVIIQLPHISTISLSDTEDEQPQEKSVRSTRTKTRLVQAEKEKNREEINKTKTVEESKEEDPKKKIIKTKKSIEKPEINETAKNNDNVNSTYVEEAPVRSTRTKTRAMAAKTNKKDQNELTIENEPSKRSRSQSPADPNENKRKKSIETHVVNETYVKTPEKPSTIANETVIISKEQRMIITTPLNQRVPVDDLLTDDEDDKIYTKPKGTTTKKPIFSQYETSPVKKRVEAFEKLGAQIAGKSQTTTKKNKPPSTMKSKQITPLKSGIPTYTNGPTSSSKTQSASKSALKNVLPPKTISALKTSQQEYIEREARRKEKELEAARKKEALLQAKQEEIKRKNEEKQFKVAQLKAKQEAEEMERVKEQQRQVKHEKIQQKKQQKKKERPLYMDMTAPLLPLDDCFDSDDERQGRYERPSWTRSRCLLPVLMGFSYAGMDVINTFFMRKATTPNLEDVFGPMNSHKLKRTSSAVWTKPPRFTLMPIPQRIEEDEL